MGVTCGAKKTALIRRFVVVVDVQVGKKFTDKVKSRVGLSRSCLGLTLVLVLALQSSGE